MHPIRRYISIIEDLSMGSAIELSEIPASFSDLPVIGQGATSIVLKKSEDQVILLTRDPVKADWLAKQGLGVRTGEFRSKNPRIGLFNKFPIHVFEMPRLYPCQGENADIVAHLIAEVKAVKTAAWSRNKKGLEGVEEKEIVAHFTADEQHRLYPVFRFLKSKSWMTYDLDLEPENFMQTRDGEIVIVDPVISRALQTVLFRFAPPN
jgi:hypothetical protein